MTEDCNRKKCDGKAAYRFTWPGTDEAGICEKCVPSLRGIAEALGLHLQIIPLAEPDSTPPVPAES